MNLFKASSLILLAIGCMLLIIYCLWFPAGNKQLSIAERNSLANSSNLCEIGRLVQNYNKLHGSMPSSMGDVVGGVSNINNRYGIPQRQSSRILVYEKYSVLTNGFVGVCTDELTVKYLTKEEFSSMKLDK